MTTRPSSPGRPAKLIQPTPRSLGAQPIQFSSAGTQSLAGFLCFCGGFRSHGGIPSSLDGVRENPMKMRMMFLWGTPVLGNHHMVNHVPYWSFRSSFCEKFNCCWAQDLSGLPKILGPSSKWESWRDFWRNFQKKDATSTKPSSTSKKVGFCTCQSLYLTMPNQNIITIWTSAKKSRLIKPRWSAFRCCFLHFCKQPFAGSSPWKQFPVNHQSCRASLKRVQFYKPQHGWYFYDGPLAPRRVLIGGRDHLQITMNCLEGYC